jgi:hypothetical protein
LLAEVFAPSAESRLPVAVIDAEDHLLGVIPRATLLSAMASLTTTEPHEEYIGGPEDPLPTGLAVRPDGTVDPDHADAMPGTRE